MRSNKLYCPWCEQNLAETEFWFPYCSQYCTKKALKAGWSKLGKR